ncbi:antibiotic biosynthesis monooxygenase [Sphingomonas jatrophae]|uniref:antibiotic biosynthesis monooxygenase n=1 Tax=Sphingomonas jatrophae TaxID=1166337 RepID=UPI0024183804|nr:antibiotic biosynthesis monooxygenase [Sphingomonas jatrophae]
MASRVVRADRTEAFEAWAARIDQAAAEAPGHLGTVRLEQTGGVVHLLYRFEDAAALERWEASDRYRALQAEGDELAVPRRVTGTGTSVRFALPGEADAANWKKWLLTWIAVFPLLVAFNTGLRALPVELPLIVQLALTSLVVTATLTWVILPRVTRWAKPWILSEDGEARTPG